MAGAVKIVVLDTSVLVADPGAIYEFGGCALSVPLTVIEELDGLKTRPDGVGRSAREALRRPTRRRSVPSSIPSRTGSMPTWPSTLSLDNGSSHVSKETRAWFAAHPRWSVHYTPPHASWVNQIELFFSILQRKVIRNGNFDSREDLVSKMLGFISDYDRTAKPFAWTYSGDPLKVA